MQLRKVCNHPFLFEEADPHPEYTDESIIEASGKLKVMDKLLSKLHAAGHRVVIFSQFTRVLDIIGDYLNFRGYDFCRLDGSSNRVQRQISINMFNAKNTTLFAFIMSTRAGGLGVNLQTADTVSIYLFIYVYVFMCCISYTNNMSIKRSSFILCYLILSCYSVIIRLFCLTVIGIQCKICKQWPE